MPIFMAGSVALGCKPLAIIMVTRARCDWSVVRIQRQPLPNQIKYKKRTHHYLITATRALFNDPRNPGAENVFLVSPELLKKHKHVCKIHHGSGSRSAK